jgi:hypothetical protein
MLEPFLEGLSLEDALEAKKIFIIDLEILEGVYCKTQTVKCNGNEDDSCKLQTVNSTLKKAKLDLNFLFSR